ncbi:MAG: hypothetical protein ACRDGJ_05515 [Candidatus Limnocylindria bacterium]
MHRAARILALAALVTIAACSATTGDQATPVSSLASSPPASGSEPPVAGGDSDGILQIEPGSAGGPGISIDEALAQAGIGPLLVNGSLFVGADGTVLLCSALAESYPPQCGGSRLEVRGLDPASIPDLQEANGVRWADAVQLFGTVSLVEN